MGKIKEAAKVANDVEWVEDYRKTLLEIPFWNALPTFAKMTKEEGLVIFKEVEEILKKKAIILVQKGTEAVCEFNILKFNQSEESKLLCRAKPLQDGKIISFEQISRKRWLSLQTEPE